jgi:glycosyltransferase involved in cell wall biosynthesis
MNAQLVSVVIPTYNYGHFVTGAVDSVLAQTYRDLEVIVVDDGSTDDTRERLKPYGDRIRYIYQPNQGLPAARNTGIRAARGELIALLDSDDQWHPRKLEVQMMYLARRPETGLVAARMVTHLERSWPEIGDPLQIVAHPVTAKAEMIRCRIGPSGVLIRKQCLDAVGLFDTDLRSAEDRDMWIRIASKFPVVRLEAPLFWYRLHGNNMSRAAVRMEEYEMRVLKKAFASNASLRRDLVLRLKVYSHASKSAAYRYDTAGMRLRALRRVLWSLLLWPFPNSPDVALTRFERPKMLVLFCLRLVRSLFQRRCVGTANG